MTWNITRILMVLICASAVAACNQTTAGGRQPMPQTNVEVAGEVCETTALAEEHRTMTSRIGSIESGAPTNYHDDSWTILLEKLNKYRADIDAAYRFVTMNCKAYNLCMQAHRYSEMDCASSRSEWSRSHERFNQLSLDLAKLEMPHRPPHSGKPGDVTILPVPGPGCNTCDIQGGVFATGCCKKCCHDGD